MLNEVKLIGRVGKDPEIKRLDNEKCVVKFSVATTEKYTDKSGEKKELTEWHNCSAWGKLAEIIEKYVKKGKLIYVSGKIQYQEYENKEGSKVKSTNILVNDMKMLEPKNTQSEIASAKQPEFNDPTQQSEPDDLPF
jgi:single-strand DNA-binding protein